MNKNQRTNNATVSSIEDWMSSKLIADKCDKNNTFKLHSCSAIMNIKQNFHCKPILLEHFIFFNTDKYTIRGC